MAVIYSQFPDIILHRQILCTEACFSFMQFFSHNVTNSVKLFALRQGTLEQ